jgi:hypothetical protein
MKNLLLCIVAALFIFSPLLLSCTKSEDVETEKGAIDRMTEEAGKEMADRITVPLQKAKNAKELVDENYRDMEENLENQ